MNKQDIKTDVVSSLFWKLMERGGTQGIQFILQLILARLLLPKDFGIIAIVMVFISIANVFVQSGFNTALIQSVESDELDFSSVFYISLIVAVILYIVLFINAPIIASFYNMQMLTDVIRVLSITLLPDAFNSVQNAIISRKMQFKKLFFSSFQAIIVSGTIGVGLAYAGYGVWALVVQQLINKFLVTIFLFFKVKWRPKKIFSLDRIKILFSYSSKILASSLLSAFFENFRSLIIGKIYNSSMLGFYNRGQQIPSIIVNNINGSIQSVMLPTLSLQQDNIKRVKAIVRRSIVTSSFIIFPMMIGIIVVAKPLVILVLTEKWLPSVPFIQIYCLSYALWPIHTANLQAINALGRSDIFLKLEIFKKLIEIIILVISLQFNIYVIAIGALISSFISTFINSFPNLKLLNYSFKEQWRDIIPSFILASVMGVIISSIQFMGLSLHITLLIQVLLGVIIYFSLAYFFKLECLGYLIEAVKLTFKKRKIKS